MKGGKTAKRGKAANPKLRVLTFSDIENGLSCFGQSASSWADTMAELSPDRLLSMRYVSRRMYTCCVESREECES